MRLLLSQFHLLFPAGDRPQIAALFLLSSLGALLELGGVCSILPFVALVSSPQALGPDHLAHQIHHQLHLTTAFSQLVFWSLMVLAALTMVQGIALISLSWGSRLALKRALALCQRLHYRYLSRPFALHLEQHSSDLRIALARAQRLSGEVYHPLILLLVRGVSALTLVALLLSISPAISLFGGGLLAGLWVPYYLRHRATLAQRHRNEMALENEIAQILSDQFQVIKHVYLSGSAWHCCQDFGQRMLHLGEQQRHRRFLEELPKVGLHLTSQIGLLGVILYLHQTLPDRSLVLPTVSLFALASYRLIPQLQSCLSCLVSLEGSAALLASIWPEVSQAPEPPKHPTLSHPHGMVWNHSIRLAQVTYTYSQRPSPALYQVDLEILHGSKVAIVGSTGSGKSTLLNLLCGLLEADSGQILIDGRPLEAEQLASWRASLGCVSQDIDLVSGSLEDNIAWGRPGPVDHPGVYQAAQGAALHEFIQQLPQGYATRVGESGVQLSGGQRQRLALARALYKRPALLILDEATSALDHGVEEQITRQLRDDHNPRTIVLVTHRLSSIQDCDRIYVLEGGRLVGEGNYLELLSNCDAFRRLLPEHDSTEVPIL